MAFKIVCFENFYKFFLGNSPGSGIFSSVFVLNNFSFLYILNYEKNVLSSITLNQSFKL